MVLETSLRNTWVNIFNICMVLRSYDKWWINVEKNKAIILEFIREYASNEIYRMMDSFCANYAGNIGFGIQKLDTDDSYQYNIYTTQPLNAIQVSEFYSLFPDLWWIPIGIFSDKNMCGICFNNNSLVSFKIYALGMEVSSYQWNNINIDSHKFKILFTIFWKFTSDFFIMRRHLLSWKISDKYYLNFTNKHLYFLTENLFWQLSKYLNFHNLSLSYLLGKEITYIASSGGENLEFYFKLN